MNDQNHTAEHQPQTQQEQSLTRAEWISSAAFIIAAASIIYTAGIETQRLNDHDRRITVVETTENMQSGKIESVLVTASRIEAKLDAQIDERNREHGK